MSFHFLNFLIECLVRAFLLVRDTKNGSLSCMTSRHICVYSRYFYVKVELLRTLDMC